MRNIRVADRSEWVRDPRLDDVPPRRSRRQAFVDLIATIPTIVLLPALVLVLGPAAAASPTLTVRPGEAVAGQMILVAGDGFPRGDQGELIFDSRTDATAPYRANGAGAFRVRLAIPSDAAPGDHSIVARSATAGPGEDRSAVAITVLEPAAAAPSSQPATAPAPEPSITTSGVAPTPTAAPTAAPPALVGPTATPALPVSTLTAPAATPVAPSQNLANIDVGVRAYYYLWWSANHWHDKLGPNYPYDAATLPLPAVTDPAGCGAVSAFVGNQLVDVAATLESQDDTAVIARDVRLAKAAGMAGFLLNWGGTGTSTQSASDSAYTRRFAAVLSASRSIGGFTNWLSYKTSSMPSVAAIKNDATFIFEAYGSNSAWARIAGKPVFALTGSRKYATTDLAALSIALRPMFFLIGDESSTTMTADRLALFDGMSYYWSSQNPYTNPGSFAQVKSIADRVHAAGKPWFAPVAPGYNSQLLRGGSCVPRNDGETLRRLWAGNRASDPNGWAVISWNEIAENTHVLPLTKWGTRYLDVLGDLIAAG